MMLEFDGRFRQGSILFVNVPWCKYCREAHPILEDVSRHFGNAVPVYDVNGDTWKEFLTVRLGDHSPRQYPTILFIGADGRVSTFDEERSVDAIVAWACDLAGHGGDIKACLTIK